MAQLMLHARARAGTAAALSTTRRNSACRRAVAASSVSAAESSQPQQTDEKADSSNRNRRRRSGGDVFRFRHFDIRQDRCAQRVGTDAMLLGSWASPAASAAAAAAAAASAPSCQEGERAPPLPPPPPRVLDIGTGSGVLALMAAQKGPPGTMVDAIDIDEAAAAQASGNAAASKWASQIRVARASLQEWRLLHEQRWRHGQLQEQEQEQGQKQEQGQVLPPLHYDAIVSNPPFFVSSSKPEACDRRAAARHADVALPLPELAAGCSALLREGGALHVVLPPVEAVAFLRSCAAEGLSLEAAAHVYTSRKGDEEGEGAGGGSGSGGGSASSSSSKTSRAVATPKPPKRVLLRLSKVVSSTAATATNNKKKGGEEEDLSEEEGRERTAPTTSSEAELASSADAAEAKAEAEAAAEAEEAADAAAVLRGGPGGEQAMARAAARIAELCVTPVETIVVRASRSSSSSSPSSREGAPYTEAYRRLTADFHHPDFFK